MLRILNTVIKWNYNVKMTLLVGIGVVLFASLILLVREIIGRK